MKLFRGENNKIDGFKVHPGNDPTLAEQGPGVYFFDEEAPEQLERGCFYECSLAQSNSRLLNEIPTETMQPLLEELLADFMDHNAYNTGFLDQYHTDPDDAYERFKAYLLDQDNLYDLIRELHKNLEPDCNAAFVASLGPTLDQIGSYAAQTDRPGEIIVYCPEKVVIDRVLDVDRSHLAATRAERMAMTHTG